MPYLVWRMRGHTLAHNASKCMTTLKRQQFSQFDHLCVTHMHSSNPLLRLLRVRPPLHITADLFDPTRKEVAFRLVLPDHHAQIFSIPDDIVKIGLGRELLHEEAGCRLHSVALDLPEPNLIDHCGRQDRQPLRHLRVRVRRQVRDDLVRGDAVADGALDGLFCQLSRDKVREAGGEAGEEAEDSDLEERGGVGVESIIRLDDYVAFVGAGGAVEAV